ncbi:hypothetical protein CCZ01_06325 [Helicobacter monodelphidis]|uniref:DUF262 domain-containing protein n=1 Tax=Helicobacter sp. 15-1451 TaxID=2004995 RepID=UPI000DCE56F9|nr:DUF262 domain-containing protein [Helicobacter sp. 15-1451]RAX57312.1 hypothetical protein CCZ01_06325 [Helicobacter sp. 15-1451]
MIDGQQRLTTFSILVKSLYDCLDEKYKGDYGKYLFKEPTSDKNPKIQHSRIDKEYFNKILQAENYTSLQIDGYNRLVKCYEYFTKRIENNIENKLDFLKFIKNSKLWVIINLDANEDEQKIFDSINTAGLKLTATDIIKNAIFAKVVFLKMEYEKIYQEYWENIFETEQKKIFGNKKL